MKKLALLLLLVPAVALGQPMPTEGLGGVIVHTDFAHDRGAVLDYLEYQGKKYEPQEAPAALLPKIGWKEKEKRQDLARAWVHQVCLIGCTPLEKEPDDFKEAKVDFQPPRVTLLKDGSVEVVLWYRDPVGMVPAQGYSKRSYRFSDQGRLTVKALEDISIPFK